MSSRNFGMDISSGVLRVPVVGTAPPIFLSQTGGFYAARSETFMLKIIRVSQHRPDAVTSVQIDAVRWRHRKIPLSRGGHITGRYSPGPGRTGVPYESLAERCTIAYLYALPGVRVIVSQPFSIQYRLGKRRRCYTPDLLVIAESLPDELVRNGFGKVTVLEVKAAVDPSARASLDFKLHLSIHATGFPALVVLPAESDTEVDHEL